MLTGQNVYMLISFVCATNQSANPDNFINIREHEPQHTTCTVRFNNNMNNARSYCLQKCTTFFSEEAILISAIEKNVLIMQNPKITDHKKIGILKWFFDVNFVRNKRAKMLKSEIKVVLKIFEWKRLFNDFDAVELNRADLLEKMSHCVSYNDRDNK